MYPSFKIFLVYILSLSSYYYKIVFYTYDKFLSRPMIQQIIPLIMCLMYLNKILFINMFEALLETN